MTRRRNGDDQARVIALTMGEPAGIGGEIAIKSWQLRKGGTPPFVLIDDPERIRELARRTGLAAAVETVDDPEQAIAVFVEALPVLPLSLSLPERIVPGRPDPKAAPAVIEAIDRAVALTRAGRTAAVVTNPIHKTTLYAAGFGYPGHTEYLADGAGLGAPAVMMLVCASLRVVPVTVHLPLAQAVAKLSTASIVHCGRRSAESLSADFAIARPRIAVAGLNPHAGEDGNLGAEEIDIIAPAVAELRGLGFDATGPHPADTLFHEQARRDYDAAICMYHDQALIPLKTIDFAGGVNMTLGLPYVRTSPDHGTAFGIAGTGRADPASLIAALRLAGEVARNRAAARRGRKVA